MTVGRHDQPVRLGLAFDPGDDAAIYEVNADQAAALIFLKLLETGPEHILLLVDDKTVRAQCGRYIDDVDAGSCGAVDNADLVRVVPCTQKCPCR